MSLEDIQKPLHDEMLFLILLSASLVVVFIACAVLYFSFKKPKKLAESSNSTEAVHVHNVNKQAWRKDIDAIVEKYHNNELTKDQACAKLASIARSYISKMSGEDIQTHTLGELASLRLKWRNKKGADMLRQTISALYPPEFADRKANEQARNTTVEQAAEWVLVLLEGWQTKDKR